MKTLGIIGGVSWHSSAEYYRQLNEQVAVRKGQRHSARVVMTSIDFADLLAWQKDVSQEQLKTAFLKEGERLKDAGCGAFIIASHTLTWLGELIEAELGLKHISLYAALFNRLHTLGVQRVGLLGTRYTMSDQRYRDQYQQAGFAVVTPEEPHLTRTATIVYKELVNGVFRSESKLVFEECFEHLSAKKVGAIVLGCTEIGLLVREREWSPSQARGEYTVPLVDLIETHVAECVDWMIRD